MMRSEFWRDILKHAPHMVYKDVCAALENGADPNMRIEEEILFWDQKDSSTRGHMRFEYDDYVRTGQNQTVLMLAVAWRVANIVQALIDHGADVNAEDNNHAVALDYAIFLFERIKSYQYRAPVFDLETAELRKIILVLLNAGAKTNRKRVLMHWDVRSYGGYESQGGLSEISNTSETRIEYSQSEKTIAAWLKDKIIEHMPPEAPDCL